MRTVWNRASGALSGLSNLANVKTEMLESVVSVSLKLRSQMGPDPWCVDVETHGGQSGEVLTPWGQKEEGDAGQVRWGPRRLWGTPKGGLCFWGPDHQSQEAGGDPESPEKLSCGDLTVWASAGPSFL